MPAGPRAFSLSKDKIRVLLLEGISERAAALFADAGYTQIKRQAKALQGEGLTEALAGVHILGIRSRTQLTAPIFALANRLMVVGCFSVGTNQVDLAAARVRGIPIFNAPFSNTRSVAELVIGEIIMLLRRIPTRSACGTVGQIVGSQLRDARENARYCRLRQHRQPAQHDGRGDGHARHLL